MHQNCKFTKCVLNKIPPFLELFCTVLLYCKFNSIHFPKKFAEFRVKKIYSTILLTDKTNHELNFVQDYTANKLAVSDDTGGEMFIHHRLTPQLCS